jgi:S1-C subfamily serine protease
VEITRGGAAEKAGLRDNDKILQLNDTKTDKWSDLSKFVNSSKPGDKVKINYSRNGKTLTTEAILITRKDIKCDTKCEPIGFLGVTEDNDDEDAPGVSVSITEGSGAEKAGLADEDVIYQLNDTPIADFEDISDFMAYTKPGEKVLVSYEHKGQRKTVEAILGNQNNTRILGNLNGAYTLSSSALKKLDRLPNVNCTIKEKEACLGVYSNETQDRGTTIESFTTESAAREVGMVEGDIILSVNGQTVRGHSELWDQIAKYKTGDKVDVSYEHDGKSLQVKATLKACRDNQSRVEIFDQSEGGKDQNRRFYTGSWGKEDQRHLRETRIIIIRRAGDGDGTKVNINPNANQPVQDRSLVLQSFKAYPNPSQGQVTVEFKAEPVETVVSLLDISGRQLFREELNAFNGEYSQQFDLTAYAKGAIIIHVQQNDKVFTEQIIVN